MAEIWNKRFEDHYYLTVEITDVSTGSSGYVVAPHAGYVTKIYSVIAGTIGTAPAVITASIGGVNLTNGVISILHTGSGAGDVDECTPTSNNKVDDGDAIKLTTAGASTNTILGRFTIEIKRNLP